MSELQQRKPIAYVEWPEFRDKDGAVTGSYGVKVADITVWLKARDDSMRFGWIKSRLHPGAGPAEAQLIFVCPFCASQLRAAGDCEKTFQWEQLDHPVVLPFPETQGSPEPALQVVRITILEPCGCPQCGKFFVIRENGIARR